jgi:hypothetical protein
MTIDAVRGGFRVVEVPVGVDHAHTGRGVAGFSHRAAQGWDLLRALWPRLLAERTRCLLLAALAVLVVGVLAASAAAAVPTGAPLARADRVVLVAAPPILRLDDLDDPRRPELAAIAGGRGAVAATNVDVPGRSPWSTWATVGAGTEIRAGPPTKPPDAANPFLVHDVEDGQGRLGTALHRAGRKTAFVGFDPTSPVRLAVADAGGEIDRGATAGSLGVRGLVNRTRDDLAAGASVAAVDASNLDPAGVDDLLAGLRPRGDERLLLLLVTPAGSTSAFGLRPLVVSGPGAPAGRLVSPSTRRDGLVVLTDVAPTILTSLGLPVPEAMIGRPLRRLARPPDIPGLIEADRLARQRDTVWDPALLVIIPLHFAVYAWAWRRRRRGDLAVPAFRPGPPAVTARAPDRPPERDAEESMRGSALDVAEPRPAARSGADGREAAGLGGPARAGAVDVASAVIAGGGAAERHADARPGAPGVDAPASKVRYLLALALIAWPLATWLVRALPGSGSLGRWAGLLAVAVDAVVVAAAWRAGRGRGLAPLAVVLGATIALVTIDLGLGGNLQLSSAIGGAAHTAGRFTGLGNPAFAVYAASALIVVHCGRRRAPWMAALLVLVALTDALPSLGGDVGGVVTLVPVFAMSVAALWRRISWRAVALATVATGAVLGVALAVDLSRPADARTHLARFVAGGGGTTSIGDKLGQNLSTYVAAPPLVGVVLIALGFAYLLWRGHFRRALPPGTPARIGVAAALAVALLGNLVNDSGPIVTLLAMSIICPALVARSAASEAAPKLLPPLGGPTAAAP